MHSVLEGVVKNFFKYWFNSEFSSNNCSLRKFTKEIDQRVLLILPPKFIPSTPRSINTHNLWRAHEYLSFILYYALPVFRDIMQFDQYQNLKKLILFIETILAPKIDITNLKKVEKYIIEFVEELEYLYPKSIMLSGVHELLHLTQCTIDFGPLNSINCFQFEELNRKLVRFIHGYDLIGEELIKIFAVAQSLSCFMLKIQNEKIKNYIISRMPFKTSNVKNASTNLCVISLLNKSTKTIEPSYIKTFELFLQKSRNDMIIYSKVIYNGTTYTSYHNKTKRCDSCFINKNNQIGLIECFVLDNNKVYIIARKVVTLFNAFYDPSCPDIKSNAYACYISNEQFVDEIINVKKIALINLSNNNCFVSLFNSGHLFS